MNVSELTGKDVPIIDPKNEGKSLKDKLIRLMQTKVFKMMTLRDLINKLLGEAASANTARERLQLVLAHDRVDMSSLTTDLLDKMRKEILDVVAKYVEIDFEEVAVSLETENRMTALVANLPIKRTFQEIFSSRKILKTKMIKLLK